MARAKKKTSYKKKTKSNKLKNKKTSQISHTLIPKHTKLTEKQKEDILKKYQITFKELPKFFITDQAIRHLEAKPGDVIKIERESMIAGKVLFYRGVVNE